MTRHRHHRIKLRSLYQWHRYLGIIAALFVVLIGITGILLNHTEDLDLDDRYLQNQWLLDWYGIDAPAETAGYRAERYWVSQWDGRILMQESDLGFQGTSLHGALSYQGILILAFDNTLMLLSHAGELVETLQDYQGVPSDIRAIGLTAEQRVMVRTGNGSYIADNDLLNWQPATDAAVEWSVPSRLPESVYRDMLHLYRGKGLDMERVVLDLHSGRLLGRGGIYFFDFIAVCMLFLAFSGLWLWTIRYIKSRNHNRS